MAMEPPSRLEPSPEDPGPAPGGGRPKHFEGPTVRLNLLVPEETAKRIRHLAVEKGVSPSRIVHDWAEQAPHYEVLARRVQELKEELKEEQENNKQEGDQSLSWWD